MMNKESNALFTAYDGLVATLGEAYVIRIRWKPGHMFLIVRDKEDGKKNGVDIIETWDDTNGHHEVWHEVKTDQKAARGKSKDAASAQELYTLLTVLDASPTEGGTGNMFVEMGQWDEYRRWAKGWYPKYKKLLDMEGSKGIKRDRMFWYYTTTSGFIDVPNGGQRDPDAISNPDDDYQVTLTLRFGYHYEN